VKITAFFLYAEEKSMERIKTLIKDNWSRFAILYVFWLLLTNSFQAQQMIAGLICCMLVVAFSTSYRLPPRSRMRLTPRNVWWLFLYAIILIREIFIANLSVAKILLSRDMQISPTIAKFHSRLKTPFLQVLLANSITLTPGTLTISVDDDTYLVHCLTEKGAFEVAEWPLKYWLQNVEKEGEW
jgi:multicomponent Na+:H+ antiporter subunit E